MSRINTTSTLRIPTTDNKHQPRIERRKPRKPKWMEHTPVKNKFSRSTEHLKHNVDVLHYRPPRHVGGFEPSGATKTEREVADEMLKKKENENKKFSTPAKNMLTAIKDEETSGPTKVREEYTGLEKVKGEFIEKVKEQDEKKKKNKKKKNTKKNDDDGDDAKKKKKKDDESSNAGDEEETNGSDNDESDNNK